MSGFQLVAGAFDRAWNWLHNSGAAPILDLVEEVPVYGPLLRAARSAYNSGYRAYRDASLDRLTVSRGLGHARHFVRGLGYYARASRRAERQQFFPPGSYNYYPSFLGFQTSLNAKSRFKKKGVFPWRKKKRVWSKTRLWRRPAS